MNHGGIILCGGRSSRMGFAKHSLPFGPESMLERIVRLLSEVCRPIVVVAARGQDLPRLACDVIVTRDRRADRGPLEGLAAGLAALSLDVEATYATSCDVPLLRGDFVRLLFDLLGEASVAVPVSGGFHHPLSAVYRRTLLGVIDGLLAGDRLRPGDLFDVVPTRRVSESELVRVDPRLDTLKNLNRPEDYLAALERAGFEAPADVLSKLSGRE
jgi:molybdenum cofactor guanylyltransferase